MKKEDFYFPFFYNFSGLLFDQYVLISSRFNNNKYFLICEWSREPTARMMCLIPPGLGDAIKKFLTNISVRGSTFSDCGSIIVIINHIISSTG